MHSSRKSNPVIFRMWLFLEMHIIHTLWKYRFYILSTLFQNLEFILQLKKEFLLFGTNMSCLFARI
jgi:hypothetical protein